MYDCDKRDFFDHNCDFTEGNKDKFFLIQPYFLFYCFIKVFILFSFQERKFLIISQIEI